MNVSAYNDPWMRTIRQKEIAMRHVPSFPVLVAWILPLALAAGAALAEVRTETVRYGEGDVTFEGYLAYDTDFDGKRPGVLVFHEWWGLNDYAKGRARQLAELGYVALAADMYGGGRTAADPQAAGELAKPLRDDRALMRRRAILALDKLLTHPLVDDESLAAIGFCFGGTVALELARAAAPLDAVVSFHGGLGTPEPRDARNIRGFVLVLHGAADPHVPPQEVLDFWKAMNDAKVDWQMNAYGGAVHAFTNPAAGSDPAAGSAYDPTAAQRAWADMKLAFLQTIGVPAMEKDGVRGFLKEKVAEPTTEAGKTTGRAVKRAGQWVWDKLAD